MAIKKLQNNFTTPEQSKRLLELGVPADSADLYFYKTTSTVYIDGSIPKYLIDKGATYSVLLDAKKRALREDTFTMLPCWSVGRLIEIWEVVTEEKWLHETKQPVIEELISDFSYYSYDNDDPLDFSKLNK